MKDYFIIELPKHQKYLVLKSALSGFDSPCPYFHFHRVKSHALHSSENSAFV